MAKCGGSKGKGGRKGKGGKGGCKINSINTILSGRLITAHILYMKTASIIISKC